MIIAQTTTSTGLPEWVTAALIPALIAAVVGLIVAAGQMRRGRTDRQRELVAEAYADVASYQEFPYIIRRRAGHVDDRTRITSGMSENQGRLNRHTAILRIEMPNVGRAYEQLARQTRLVAGEACRVGWDKPVFGTDVAPNGTTST